jgi:hypothetical protein
MLLECGSSGMPATVLTVDPVSARSTAPAGSLATG